MMLFTNGTETKTAEELLELFVANNGYKSAQIITVNAKTSDWYSDMEKINEPYVRCLNENNCKILFSLSEAFPGWTLVEETVRENRTVEKPKNSNN